MIKKLLNNKNIVLLEDATIEIDFKSDKENFEYILSKKLISTDNIKLFLKEEYKIDTVDLDELDYDKILTNTISYNHCEKYKAVPININQNKLTVAMDNPFNYKAIDDLNLITQMHIIPVFSHYEDIKKFMNRIYINIEDDFFHNNNENDNKDSVNISIEEDIKHNPIVKLTDQIIENAVARNASDIHIEPQKNSLRIRYRLDGNLFNIKNINLDIAQFIISRIKVISYMDTAQKKLPQEGYYKKMINNQYIEFRVSSIPTIYGEKIVIRLIYNKLNNINIESLGFFEEDANKIRDVFKNNNGLVLVTGATGSGKSTTLGAFIREINKHDINIVTIEDPIENEIEGINQILINPKNGFGFNEALKFILRQDPDVIMIGEIRDEDTALTTVRSAMTGHLVLSTLHTNDSISSIERLIDMGIPIYLIISTIKCIVSQKLIRRLCNFCKIKTTLDEATSNKFNLNKNTVVYENQGCIKCNNMGYMGRFAIYEVLIISSDIKNMLVHISSKEEIKNVLRTSISKNIWDTALENVLLGNTTMEEVFKILY